MIVVNDSQQMRQILNEIKLKDGVVKEDKIYLNYNMQQLMYHMAADNGAYLTRFKNISAWNELLDLFKLKENMQDNNIDYSNTVDVYMASLPRQNHVILTAKSILSQKECRSLTISLSQKYKESDIELVKRELSDPKVKIDITDDAKCSNEKLKHIGEGTGEYIALVDDDCIYPQDYLNYLISGCEKHNAHVSLHGVVLAPRPIKSYYRDRHVFRGLATVNDDYEVDICASCMTLFKRSFHQDLGTWYDQCSSTSMDDIYISNFAKNKDIKCYVLKHNEGWVKHKVQYKEDNYVFDKYALVPNADRVQTEFINNNWKMF